MKKVLSVLLSIFVVLGCVSVLPVGAVDTTSGTGWVNTPAEPIQGDVNGDQISDLKDVTSMSRSVAGWYPVTIDFVSKKMDLDGSGVTDLADVTLISRYLAGWNIYFYNDDNLANYAYDLKYNIVNWVCVGDVVYAITSGPNRLWVFNAATMKILADKSLPGTPAEIQAENGKLLISFPTLKSIKSYDINTYSFMSSIDLPGVVSSFVVDGNIVYYCEDDQWCDLYRTDLTTNTTINKGSYYYPKLLLNKADNLLYLVECGNTGSKVYYFNATDLSIQSSTSGYGYSNGTRYGYFDGNNLYAMTHVLDKKNASRIVGEYSSTNWNNCLIFANQNYVVMNSNIYEKDTYEPVLDMSFTASKALITESGILLLVNQWRNSLYIAPNN